MLLLLSRLAASEESQRKPGPFYGRFVRVIDGDTLVIKTRDGKEVSLDLWGIDAPELKQPNGDRAKRFLNDLIEKTRDRLFKYDLRIEEQFTDEDGARKAIIKVVVGHSIPDLRRAVGEEVQFQIIRGGWAWHDRTNTPDDEKLAAASSEAKEARRGLWADESPVPPWEWRKQHDRDEMETGMCKVPASRRRVCRHGAASEQIGLRRWCNRRCPGDTSACLIRSDFPRCGW
jgi:endonuclease YncB( thermonuclease family)